MPRTLDEWPDDARPPDEPIGQQVAPPQAPFVAQEALLDEVAVTETLSARQDAVAVAIACGKTVKNAAASIGAGESTVWAWHKQLAFRNRLAELRRELVNRTLNRLADAMAGKALDRLLSLVDSDSSVMQLHAVREIFDRYVAVEQAAELRARIEQLEAEGGR
jgi:hypothetical protein